MKTCTQCNVEKYLTEFEKRADTGNIRTQCKTCRNEYVKRYKQERSNGTRQKHQVNVIQNRKQCSICKETKDLSEFPIRTDTSHGYRSECKDCKKIKLSEYYADVYNQVRRERKLTDIEYRLICNHRNYIYKCLTKFTKQHKSIRYLGCTLEVFKKWLEFQFDEDMTWKNYGTTWTVDHILPLDLFNLNSLEEQYIAFNWKNMQPLKDNFVKNNKIRLYEYFNAFISAHRFIKRESLKKEEYQGLSKSLNWLREKLRYGNNLIDGKSSDVIIMMKTLQIDNPHPSTST